MTHFSWPIDGSIVGLYLLATMIAGIMVRKYVGKVEHFLVAMEEATLELGADGILRLHGLDGSTTVIPVAGGDGYGYELQHFIDCIAHGKATTIVPPESALQSVRLIEAEIESAATGKPVNVKL